MPVYQLLGGLARTSVRLYSGVTGMTAADAANQAKEKVARGLTAIRFRAFHSHDTNDYHDHKTAVYQQIEYLEALARGGGRGRRFDPRGARAL